MLDEYYLIPIAIVKYNLISIAIMHNDILHKIRTGVGGFCNECINNR